MTAYMLDRHYAGVLWTGLVWGTTVTTERRPAAGIALQPGLGDGPRGAAGARTREGSAGGHWHVAGDQTPGQVDKLFLPI